MNPIEQAIAGMESATERMQRARNILTNGKPTPDCNWGMLDAADLQPALTSLRSLQKEVEGVLPEPHIKACPAFVGALPDCYTADQLRTAVAAALGRGAVRQGWKLVPEEPTPEMRKAAADAWLDCDSKLFLNKAGVAVRAAIAISKESA